MRKVWICVPGWWDDAEVHGTEAEAKDAFVGLMGDYLAGKCLESRREGKGVIYQYWNQWRIELDEAEEQGEDPFQVYMDMALDQYNFDYSGIIEAPFYGKVEE